MTKEKNLETRTKRAQAAVAMGLVKRTGDRFLVGAKSPKNGPGQYEVWRHDLGKVRCACDEFVEAIKTDPGFRCEHILAVKLSLASVAPETASGSAPNLATHAAERREPQVSFSNGNQAQVSAGSELAPAEKGEPEMIIPDPDPALETTIPGPNSASEVGTRSDEKAITTFRDLLRRLSEPIPEGLIKQREGWRGRDGATRLIDYIEWHTVADLLDQVAPEWSHAVHAIVPINDLVAVIASITIAGVTREGIGTGSAESEVGIKKAEHDALKRAAVKFGIARDLYKHAPESEDASIDPPATRPLPRDPLAKTLADLVTPKQLIAIRAIAHDRGLEADEECLALYGCRIEELSRRAASVLIDHLKSYQRPEPKLQRPESEQSNRAA